MVMLSDWPWRHWAKITPDRQALVAGKQRLSWFRLAQKVESLASGFSCQGVHPGSGVVLKARNSEQAVIAYLALLQCGGRLLPLNPQLPVEQNQALLPRLNIDYVLTLSGEPIPGFTALALQPLSGLIRHEWEPEAIATLTLTSGSGGLPKAAAHSFRAHLASARGVMEKMQFTADDCWLLSLPLFHVSGQGILWRWLSAGAGLAIPGDLPLHQALENCSFASLVPTQLWRLLQQPRLPLRLQNILLGGTAIPEPLTREAEKQGIACWCGYGMTETASTVAAKRADSRPGVGQALAGHQIRLRAGEVQLKSEALASGYWQQGELLPLAVDRGWFTTRDGGCWMQDELALTGRLDNQFFSGGEGVQPEQVEAILLTHPDVAQAFIIPAEDEEYGHRPVALVKLKTELSLVALAEWAREKLAGFQRPVGWYLLPDIDSGGIKVSRHRLTEWVAEQRQSKEG
ncbi:o-succinylbenzoate--CoA ligase [Erwinia sp. E_sp_B04_7]|uniref:o-succinylbenzoate--CoA ligase n=1 Tax=unclassified Erwinia TaxID=2622719 RepID=UPI0030D50322